jgi:glycosyltransferase involved in cell wall biosynthesis
VALRRQRPELGGTDSDGRARNYRLERWLYALSTAFADCAAPRHLGAAEFARVLGAWFIAKNRDPLAFIRAVEAEQEGVTTICHVAFPALGGWTARQLAGHLRPGMRVVALPSLRAVVEGLRVIPGRPRQWLRLFAARRGEDAQVPERGRARGVVLEQAYWRSIRQHPYSGHMFWQEAAGLDPGQTVLYCNRADTPADDALRREAAARGWGWIDGADPLNHLERPWPAIAAALADAAPLLPRGPAAIDWVRWALASSSSVAIAAYRALLRRYNVAAFRHCAEFGPDTIAMCLAVRRENAMAIWNQWSIVNILFARYSWAIADLILAWGPFHTSYHRAVGFDYRVIAEIGMVSADGIAPGDADEARALRARLAPDVRFVVAAFDTAFGPLVYNSEEQIHTFIAALVDLAERHPDWGLILKTKKPEGESALSRLHDRLRDLEAAGRCLIEPDLKIGIPALAADVVAGYPVSTAAIASGLRGRPVVQLDFTGFHHTPLQDSGLAGGLVHTDVASFQQALERLAGGDAGIGDLGRWVPMIDPFHDGNARLRAGRLIADAVTLRARHGVAKALELACNRYAAEVGGTHVVWPGDPPDPLWQKLQADKSDYFLPLRDAHLCE